MEMKPVESSLIAAIGHDPAKRQLHVHFKSGSKYVYQDVTPLMFQKLLEAKSIGSHFGKHIKPHFKEVK